MPPAPPNSLAAFEKNAKAEHRSFELSAGKAPTLSLSTDKKRFHLVLRANGWNDFSRHIEELRESSIKDVREIEIDLPQQACRFATPSSDARLHRCYYFERRNNEKPAEIRFVQGDQKVVTFSDGSLGQSLVVSESLALISTDGVGPEGKPTMSRHFELLLNISVFDSTQSATMNIELPLHFNHRE